MSKEKIKKRKININIKRGFLLLFIILTLLSSTGIFLLYGPYQGFRRLLITTAMTTKSHQYLATWWYSDSEIQKVLAYNKVIEVNENTDSSSVDFNVLNAANKYEREILDHDKNDLYKVIYVTGPGYNGYVVAIYDPSKVHVGTSKYLGSTGQYITSIAQNYDAKVTINAGGFYDPDWNSNGAIPHGTVISYGKKIWTYEPANVGGGIVGFNKDNVLMLGRWTANQAMNMGIRDAVEFGPFLIVNGKKSFVQGDGGWGIAPRTAIGQRKDGTVIMAVINGRGYNKSIGIDMVGLTELMDNYGCVNAANMDGGSSSALIVEGEIKNSPTAAGTNGLRSIATTWVVTE